MRYAKYLAAATVQLFWPTVVTAQHSTFDAPGLRTYVQQVLEYNASLHARRSTLGAARDRIGPAGALPDPTVSFGVMSLPVPSFDFRAEAMTQIGIGFAQTFPARGKRRAATSVARVDSILAASRVTSREAQLGAAATGAYYRLALAKTAVKLWRGRAALADQAVVVTDARYQSGAAPQTDALRARLRRARLSEELRDLEAEVIGARETARALLGGGGEVPDALLLVDVAGTPALDPVAFDIPVIDQMEPPLRNPSLRVAAATVERAARRATQFEIAGRPDLMTSLQTGIRFGDREPFFTASIGIPLALWSRRKQTPLANAAIMDLTAAEEEYVDLSVLVIAEVRTRLANLEASRLRAQQIAAVTVPLATAAAASALQQYRVGAVEFTSVLETQDEFFRVQLGLAQVVSRFGTLRAELAALTGEEWYR